MPAASQGRARGAFLPAAPVIALGALAQGNLALAPLMVGAYGAIGWGSVACGVLLAAEYAGTLIAALAVAPRVRVLPHRPVVVLAGLVIAAANLLTFAQPGFAATLALRIGAGLGIGIAAAIAGALLAATAAPARIAGLRAIGTIAIGLAGIAAERTLTQRFGAGGLFLLLALLGVAMLAVLPRSADGMPRAAFGAPETRLPPGVAAPMLLYVAIQVAGALVWTFCVPIARAGGIAPAAVNLALGIASGMVVVCGFAAEPLRRRVGWRATLLLALACYPPGVALIAWWPAPASFTIGLLLVNTTASLGGLMMIDHFARSDPDGRVAAAAAAAMAFCGMVAAPLAGLLMRSGGSGAIALAGGGLIACAIVTARAIEVPADQP